MKALLKSALCIVTAVMAVFAVIAVLVVTNTSNLMVAEATKTVKSIAKSTTGKIDQMREDVEKAVQNQKWIIGEELNDPDYMYRVTRELVANNVHIVGSTVAFAPDRYPEKGRFGYAPYTYVDADGSLKSSQLGRADNEYYAQDWFTDATKAKRGVWSEPYFDKGGAKIMMCTYSMPIVDAADTNVCAVFTADFSLEQLTKEVRSICPIANSYAILRSGTGAEIVPAPENRVVNSGDGNSLTIRDRSDNGWTVEIVCPMDEILRGSRSLMIDLGIFSVLGLGLIFFLSWFFISRLQRAVEERERLKGEFDVAQNIQANILPANFPNLVHAIVRPAREVGGDLYDVIRQGERLYFIVGDASGKGVPAALFSFMAGTVSRMAYALKLSPDEILGRINQALAHNNEMCMFVTIFVGILDLGTGDLEFSCAGHNPPVVIRPDGRAEFLAVKRGPPAGVRADACYGLQKANVGRGSRILIYTDGVTEAERADHSQFGESRLLAFAAGRCECGVHEIVNGLLRSVDEFVDGAEQSDDITIMAIGC